MRYFFILPDVTRPVGGNNVALRFVDTLSEEGYPVAALYSQADFHYRFFSTPLPAYYYPPLASIPRKFIGRKKRLQENLIRLIRPRREMVNHLLDLRPSDIFIVPELWYPEYSEIFPNNRCVLFTQHVFLFCNAYKRDIETAKFIIDKFEFIITISEATQAAVKNFAKRDSYLVPQAVSRPSIAYASKKNMQIAYMPRKRPDEVDIIVDCLKNLPELDGWKFVKIDGASLAEVDLILSESLIFLSFSCKEGFGLPPAEAMAAGCIVIGYTGVGGEEFFKPEFGLPVPDSDIACFLSTVVATVEEYSWEPARLDYMRKSASQHIHAQYSFDGMRKSLLALWKQIDDRFSLE